MGMPVQQQAQLNLHTDDPAHTLFHAVGDNVGYWPLLVLLAIGALVVLKKRIKKWLEEDK